MFTFVVNLIFYVLIHLRLGISLDVKVADFGLAQYLDEQNQYKIKTSRKALPIKWMSLEAIVEKVFSVESDIVS